jgi:hypothetical protein
MEPVYASLLSLSRSKFGLKSSETGSPPGFRREHARLLL